MSATNFPNSKEIPLSFSLILAWKRPLIWGRYFFIPFSLLSSRDLDLESEDTKCCLLNFVLLFMSSSLIVSVWSPIPLSILPLLLPTPMPLGQCPFVNPDDIAIPELVLPVR